MDINKFTRGSVWYYNDYIEDKHSGIRGILRGSRPVIIFSIVSNPNATCTIHFLPLTTAKSAKQNHPEDFEMLYHMVEIKLPKSATCSYVCCNQLTIGTTAQLSAYIGQVSSEKMEEIETAVCKYLEIEKAKKQVEDIPLEAAPESDSEYGTTAITTMSTKRAVICVEDNLLFNTLVDAANYYKFSVATLRRHVNKTTFKGRTFVTIKNLLNPKKGES